MKVLLIQPPSKKLDEFPYLPLSLISIGTEISLADNNLHILDLNLETHKKQSLFNNGFIGVVDSSIADFRPDAIGLTACCSNFPIVVFLAKYLKRKWPDVSIVAGGPHVSPIASKVLTAYKEIDIIVVGEGEVTCRELFTADGLHVDGILGILYRSPVGEIIDNGPRPLLKNLDELKINNYRLVNMEEYLNRGRVFPRHIYYEVGRGCPFSCAFCSTSSMWGRRYRVKSVARVIQEIEMLRAYYGIETYEFLHDHLLANHVYVKSLCEAFVQKKMHIKWSCSARSDSVDQELLLLMKESGCNNINMGIEAGSSRMQKMIGKYLDIDISLNAVKKCVASGIEVSTSFIIGFPEEQPDDFEKTLETALRFYVAGSSQLRVHKFLPHPSTRLYEENKNKMAICKNTPHFAAWDGKQFSVMDVICRHPDIHSSFYHIPTSSGDEDFLAKAEYFIQLLLDFFPKTLLYLVSKKRLSFRQLVTVYQKFGEGRNIEFVNRSVDWALLKKDVFGREDDAIFNSLIRYEQAIFDLVSKGKTQVLAGKKKMMDELENVNGNYHINQLIRIEGFDYNMRSLIEWLVSDSLQPDHMFATPSSYAFVFWKGHIEIYHIGEKELGCLRCLPTTGTKKEYSNYLVTKDYDGQDLEKVWLQFASNHVVIKRTQRREEIWN